MIYIYTVEFKRKYSSKGVGVGGTVCVLHINLLHSSDFNVSSIILVLCLPVCTVRVNRGRIDSNNKVSRVKSEMYIAHGTAVGRK